MNYLLDIVSDDGKPDFIVGIDFAVQEFIIGIILGIILTACIFFVYNYFKKP